MKPHFLQSSAWKNFQSLENHTTFELSGDDFSALAILEATPVGNYLYCPYGPTLDTSKSPKIALKHALEALSELARDNQAFFIRIEPTFPFPAEELRSLGLQKSHDLNPAHTWVLDLTQPQDVLLKSMRKSNVQYWQSSAKKGLKVRTSQDPTEISILSSLLKAIGEKDNFTPQDESHLKHQLEAGFATLYIAEFENQPIAAALVYDYDDTRFYAHAATSSEQRKLAAGTVLLVQMILDAKNSGKSTFDFWGITLSEDPSHPWYGFSKYKQSFGGSAVTYSGTWDYPLNSLSYKFYQIVRRLNRLKRKLLH